MVLAVGFKPLNVLQSRLEEKVTKIITIGDAVGVRKALDAVKEGYLAGLEI